MKKKQSAGGEKENKGANRGGGTVMTGGVSPTRTRFSAASVGVAYAVNWNSDANLTQHFALL